jgi:hypothetical protein
MLPRIYAVWMLNHLQIMFVGHVTVVWCIGTSVWKECSVYVSK